MKLDRWMQVGMSINKWVLVLEGVPCVPALGHFCPKTSNNHISASSQNFQKVKKAF
jgi:hypothetical protein